MKKEDGLKMRMVKVDWDELYPYYFITGSSYYSEELEFSDEELAFIEESNANFWLAQKLISDKIHPKGLY